MLGFKIFGRSAMACRRDPKIVETQCGSFVREITGWLITCIAVKKSLCAV
jgi:hypothetical protein